jgi:hypothetical protein
MHDFGRMAARRFMCRRTLLVQKWYKSWYKKTGGVMANNLLYTPFGYYLRVMVPKDLREALGKREIKKSLTTLNLSCTIKAAQLLMPEIKHLFTSLRGRTMSRANWRRFLLIAGADTERCCRVFQRASRTLGAAVP